MIIGMILLIVIVTAVPFVFAPKKKAAFFVAGWVDAALGLVTIILLPKPCPVQH